MAAASRRCTILVVREQSGTLRMAALLLGLTSACVPADPPGGAKRKPGAAARSTQGPRLGAASAGAPNAARVVATASGKSSSREGAGGAFGLITTPFHD